MLRDICGEKILIAEGQENIDFTNIISMNESSAYLWQAIEDKEFDVEIRLAKTRKPSSTNGWRWELLVFSF